MNWNDKEPIYLQIKKQIEQQILSGVWIEGEALPSIRTVATDLKINHLTVMKAYQLLVDDLLVEKVRGRGMFVLIGAKAKLKSDKTEEFLNQQIPILIETLKLLDIPVNDFTKELNKQIKGNIDATSQSK
jgi:GntR family transcriptional regulator